MANWTTDPTTGRSNSSPLFYELGGFIGRLIRDEAHSLIRGRTDDTGLLIAAQLAHGPFTVVPSSAVVAWLRSRGGDMDYEVRRFCEDFGLDVPDAAASEGSDR